ncbi:hypothetical protein [Sphingomonas sanxanigenens]|uniref:ASCH domain-containing protein n=1 Tax=Sphingomonas sanxanigenens DSM 19645 = NX02 TaxID=1123269 RepID=W0A7Z5_9SPHN|nr:hypothetical protein [Sphingomonas sanxanigenens]AHE52592.1 hypothetical protein NX02_04220 [Sphingomonas sanxanigenens DSM 19645 = NX02]
MDRPIIFSAPMVRALLAGRKTQTRRVINPQPIWEPEVVAGPTFGAGWSWGGYARWADPVRFGAEIAKDQRFSVGDRLYVREHWRSTPAYDDLAPSEMGGDEPVLYIADDATMNWGEADGDRRGRHRQGRHMPRWASRLTLIVEDVRCQPLQAISRGDAIAEGLTLASKAIEEFWRWPEPHHEHLWLSPPAAYRHLWNSLHGAGAWDANPWVAVVEFNVVKGNIDDREG